MPKKVITVFGATGAQGGSVANTFLTDPKLKDAWTVRAVTRDVTRDRALALKARGAELVNADLNDAASLKQAMAGADVVFAMTNYWEKMDMQLEIQQGKNLADAAKAASVNHYIWSSLPNVSKLTNNKLKKVYHFDSKALVEDYVRSIGLPASFFHAGFYMANLTSAIDLAGNLFARNPKDGSWTFNVPVPITTQVPMIDAAPDMGKFVKAMVLRRDEVLGKGILVASKYMTFEELLNGFKSAFPEDGKTARFNETTLDDYYETMRSVGLPEFAADELREGMAALKECGYYGGASLAETHALLEDKLTTWEEHLRNAPAFSNLK